MIFKRRLGQIGNKLSPSVYITLPVKVLRELGWQAGQSVQIVHQPGLDFLIVERVDNSSRAGRRRRLWQAAARAIAARQRKSL